MMKNSKTMLRYQEALDHAQSGTSIRNEMAVIEGFMEKGIDEDDILPRENVLTFNAWMAKGRCPRKGEHGVKITTFIPKVNKKTGEKDGVRPWTSTVFHISQTNPVES